MGWHFRPARDAANRVYETAGIGPEDLDVVELHDCFAQNELITYEALGLCREGGAAQFIGRPGDPRRYRLPRPTRFGVVHVSAERAELVPMAVDRTTFATFLRALELWRWTQGAAKTVIGKPITKEGVAA